MSDLISRESLKQRINLNYSSHQYIDAQAMKDIVDTEPTVEDKTVEELEKIVTEIENYRDAVQWDKHCLIRFEEINYILDIVYNSISKLKGETE